MPNLQGGVSSGWFNTTVDRVLERALDAAALRQQLLTNNIANVNTPGYKRSDIDFNASLRQAMDQSASLRGRQVYDRHIDIPATNPQGVSLSHETWFTQRNDESNVALESENAARDQNQIIYSAASQLYSDRMKWLSIVLDSRR